MDEGGPGMVQTQQGQAQGLYPAIGLAGQQKESGPTNPSWPADMSPQPQLSSRRYEEFFATPQPTATPTNVPHTAAPVSGNPAAKFEEELLRQAHEEYVSGVGDSRMQPHEESGSPDELSPPPVSLEGQQALAQRQAQLPKMIGGTLSLKAAPWDNITPVTEKPHPHTHVLKSGEGNSCSLCGLF
jgi:hypothetical protein